MKVSEQGKHLLIQLLYLTELLVLTGLFACVWYFFYIDQIYIPFYRRGNWVVIFVYFIILATSMYMNEGHRIGHYTYSQTIMSQIMGLLFGNALMYLIMALIGRFFLTFGPIGFMTLGQFGFSLAWVLLTDRVYHRIHPPLSMIMISGKGRHVEELKMKMETREDKYRIANRMSEADGIENILDAIPQYDAVLLVDLALPSRNVIMKYCFETNKRVYVAPRISDLVIRSGQEIHFFDTPLLLCRNYGLTIVQQIVKRIFDIVLSVLMLILLSPLMLGIALAIKIEDGGPVFYTQERLTKDKKSFRILKYRSMVVNAEKNGPQLSTKQDSRITKVGRFIRSCRMDELPQLFNILKGDMSLVGPRPERKEIAERISRDLPEFDYRLKVKAGLTGYAQVVGKYSTTPYDKLEMDLIYISRYSLLLDFRILLMTPKMLFVKDKTEGVDDDRQP